MALTSLNPNLLGTDSAGASKLSTTGGLVQLHSTGVFTIANTSANSFHVANTGLIGIGTIIPETFSARVAIASSNGANESIPLTLVNANGSANTAVSLGFAPNVNIDLARITALRTDVSGATDLQLKTYTGSSLTEKMRITANGNVGINNSTPAALANTVQLAIKANVNGDSMFVAQNSNGLTTAKFGFQYSGSVDNPVIGSYSNHPLIFLTNNTEKMRIAADGQLYHNTSYLIGSSYNCYYGKSINSSTIVQTFSDTTLSVLDVYIPTNVKKVLMWFHVTLRTNGLGYNHTGFRVKAVKASDGSTTYIGSAGYGFGISQDILSGSGLNHNVCSQFVNLYDYDSYGNQGSLTAGQTYTFFLQAIDAFASGSQLRVGAESGGTHADYTPQHAAVWVL
jgi:hypothetical protein